MDKSCDSIHSCGSVCSKLFKLVGVVGIIISSLIIRDGIVNIQKKPPTVSVKGLSERNVKADRAIWVLPINAAGDDLDEAIAGIESDTKKLVKFLKAKGVKEGDIERGVIRVYDKLSQRYYDDKNQAKRFSVDSSVTIKSNDVEVVAQANKDLNELVGQGVIIGYDGYNQNAPRYFFTKLNDVKPEMLAEATKEARKAAEQFAMDSGSKMGKVQSISQGSFSVYAREAGNGSEEQFIDKVVRVVTNAQYYLE